MQIPPINQRNIKSTTGPSQATHMPMPASASDIQFHSRNKQEEQIDEEQQVSVNRDQTEEGGECEQDQDGKGVQ
jgi:hypothetical protein